MLVTCCGCFVSSTITSDTRWSQTGSKSLEKRLSAANCAGNSRLIASASDCFSICGILRLVSN